MSTNCLAPKEEGCKSNVNNHSRDYLKEYLKTIISTIILWWSIASKRNKSGIIIYNFCGKIRVDLLELSNKERIFINIIFCIGFY